MSRFYLQRLNSTSIFTWPSLFCIDVSPSFLLLLGTLVMGLVPTRIHYDLTLITSAKSLFPKKGCSSGICIFKKLFSIHPSWKLVLGDKKGIYDQATKLLTRSYRRKFIKLLDYSWQNSLETTLFVLDLISNFAPNFSSFVSYPQSPNLLDSIFRCFSNAPSPLYPFGHCLSSISHHLLAGFLHSSLTWPPSYNLPHYHFIF